jgi:hypothetical protein
MKPAICYALVKVRFYGSRPGGFEILAVTTLKKSGHVYGRELPSETASNRAPRDVVAICDTLDDAEKALAAAQAVAAAKDGEIKATRAKLDRLQGERREAMLDAMRAFQSPKFETPRPVY